MLRKRIVIFFSIILCLLILFILNYEKFLKKNNTKKIETETPIEIPYSSNIIENVSYSTKDADGNDV